MKRIHYSIILPALLITICLFSCKEDATPVKTPEVLFRSVPITESKINFKNKITETHEFNFMNYYNIYNGGGVAVADVNNDGLEDIYLSANQESNKLYINEGKLQFRDATKEYGLEDKGGWTTGISTIDINNDGWMDFYICKSGSPDPQMRQNKLFVNQGGKSFKEQAVAYGLADQAYSTQAYFLDYDKDGDTDMYLVNHRSDFNNSIIYSPEDKKTDIYTTDKLFRNDNGRFTDVTGDAGLLNKSFGHSAAIYDFNEDGWPDIYVSNDFILGDHLYINNQDGSFTDQVEAYFDHTPFFSMGSDVADINNDMMADLIVLDMVSEDHVFNKRSMAGMSTEQFNLLVELGNHYQYMTNVLQLNRGQGVYSEVSQATGIANTDWSWAPLLADFDNDGFKDLFITNGIKRDLTDNDFKIAVEKRVKEGPMTLEELYEMIPSRKIRNYFFQNDNGEKFTDKSAEYGMDQNINSSGVAYADFDNDGDYDLIINNLDDYATLYENQSTNYSLRVNLRGPAKNRLGLGAELLLEADGERQYAQSFLNRGYQSSVSSKILFGLGDTKPAALTLSVRWPDGKVQNLTGLSANTTVSLDYKDAGNGSWNLDKRNPLLKLDAQLTSALIYRHRENEFDDFQREILLPQKYSTLGPHASTGDVNGDGLDDLFIGGAIGQAGQLFIQNVNGGFDPVRISAFEADKKYEDLGSVFTDGDGDGDLDLYVVSGGNEYPAGSPEYQDRYYRNDGKGNFQKHAQALPEIRSSGFAVAKGDYDGDGDEDLFVAGRVVPGRYPYPAASYLLVNESGRYKLAEESVIQGLEELGMVSDVRFTDFDTDGDLDLMLVGEWMGARLFVNTNGRFESRSLEELTGRGWWYSITEADFNADGKPDYVLGNLGLNNKFGARKEKEFHVFCDDFDESGNLDIVLSKEKKGKLLPVRGRECSSQQMPFIAEKFPTYKAFAESDLLGIYGEEKIEHALHYTVNNFESLVLLSTDDGNFTTGELPFALQYGPVLSALATDVNKDGHLDIIAAGNIYNAEVETVRYDASKGLVLLGNGKGEFSAYEGSGLLLDGNVKQIHLVQSGKQNKLLVVRNNDAASFYDFIM